MPVAEDHVVVAEVPGRGGRDRGRLLTCNSSATTMAADMGILVILVTTAIIVYGPKMLSLQQVTVGAGFLGLELVGVPTRRATRVYRGLRLLCQ